MKRPPKDQPIIATVFAFQLSSLTKTAGDLNRLRDQLTEAVMAVDTALSKIAPGVPAWIEKAGVSLGYAKPPQGKRWGLYIRETTGGVACEQTTEVWEFSQAPFALRLMVIPWVPELLTELDGVVNEHLKQANEALSIAAQIARAIKTP